MNRNQPSVVACVTSQYECDRIIETAEQLAAEYDCELHVLSVLMPTENYALISDQLEYLNRVSKRAGADMTIIFSGDAPKAAGKICKGERSFANSGRHPRRRKRELFGSVQQACSHDFDHYGRQKPQCLHYGRARKTTRLILEGIFKIDMQNAGNRKPVNNTTNNFQNFHLLSL